MTGPKALDAFATGLVSQGALPLDDEYRQRAQFFGVWNRKDELIGGFAFCSPPLRTWKLIPPAFQAELTRVAALDDLSEVTSVWTLRDRLTLFTRLMIWFCVAVRAAQSNPRRFLAYSRRPGLQRLYELGRPEVLAASASIGEKLYVFRLRNMALVLVRYVPHQLIRRAQHRLTRPSVARTRLRSTSEHAPALGPVEPQS